MSRNHHLSLSHQAGFTPARNFHISRPHRSLSFRQCCSSRVDLFRLLIPLLLSKLQSDPTLFPCFTPFNRLHLFFNEGPASTHYSPTHQINLLMYFLFDRLLLSPNFFFRTCPLLSPSRFALKIFEDFLNSVWPL
ncbi:hypothetical protein I3760_01G119600 [Carya illinoinensis]|nr:hypothetical protein I3760_01G119600 [Carya illinoinensis]